MKTFDIPSSLVFRSAPRRIFYIFSYLSTIKDPLGKHLAGEGQEFTMGRECLSRLSGLRVCYCIT